MAKKIEPNTLYRVVLARAVPSGRSLIHPGPNVVLRGDALQKIISDDGKAITSYEVK
ncbi:MAG: hypothetical protein AAF141_02785 [Pseudomonadota bacterium]